MTTALETKQKKRIDELEAALARAIEDASTLQHERDEARRDAQSLSLQLGELQQHQRRVSVESRLKDDAAAQSWSLAAMSQPVAVHTRKTYDLGDVRDILGYGVPCGVELHDDELRIDIGGSWFDQRTYFELLQRVLDGIRALS